MATPPWQTQTLTLTAGATTASSTSVWSSASMSLSSSAFSSTTSGNRTCLSGRLKLLNDVCVTLPSVLCLLHQKCKYLLVCSRRKQSTVKTPGDVVDLMLTKARTKVESKSEDEVTQSGGTGGIQFGEVVITKFLGNP